MQAFDRDNHLYIQYVSDCIDLSSIRHHLLYAEAQYVTHICWQQGEERVEGPVIGEVSDYDGPQRH